MRVDWQSSVEGIGGISMSEVVDVPTSQYVILAAAPRSMPSAEMTSYKPPGISVSLQVEHKQFIGNGHLIGSPLR